MRELQCSLLGFWIKKRNPPGRSLHIFITCFGFIRYLILISLQCSAWSQYRNNIKWLLSSIPYQKSAMLYVQRKFQLGCCHQLVLNLMSFTKNTWKMSCVCPQVSFSSVERWVILYFHLRILQCCNVQFIHFKLPEFCNNTDRLMYKFFVDAMKSC